MNDRSGRKRSIWCRRSRRLLFSILTIGKRSRPRQQSRDTSHKATLIGKRAKALEYAERTICGGPLRIDVFPSGANRSATAHRPSKDFGIGLVETAINY